ncbi:glycosyltransferase family 2 protein [Candidatus Nomurabacteria bacterium]|nr:glycosyltransferase family 2 protein [Candidatus Nomurabacteria bacterium]
MKEKKVSIIMPVYNASKYLDDTIASILNQTYKNWELIIINDSSTDNSSKIIEKWTSRDKRIIKIENKYAKGIHGATNSGLDIATGEFIAKADADDIQRPYRLENQIEFLSKNKDVDIVGGGYELFGNGTDGTKIYHPSNSLMLGWKFISNIYFCNPSVTYRRSVLNTIPHYPEVPCEDFAFLSKAIKKHKGVNMRKILLDYRQHNSNYSNTAKEKIQQSVQKIFEDNYLFFTGSLEYSDIFYKFHAEGDLKASDLAKILRISFHIANKIVRLYDSNHILIKSIYIYSVILNQIIKSVVKHYLRKIFR